MEYLGNTDLLKLHKTAFLCSQKCPAEIILKSYDWAKQQRKAGNCIVCGNHSQIERDVFEILLKGKQPLILVLARDLKKRIEPEFQKGIDTGRLLILTPFQNGVSRVTKQTSVTRNKMMIELAHSVTVGYIREGGLLEELLKHYNSHIIAII